MAGNLTLAQAEDLVAKNLIYDIFNFTFYKDGKVVCYSKNLTAAGISCEISETEVKNGQGNGLFAVIKTGKDIKVTTTSNVFDFRTLALNNGTDVYTGAGTAYTTYFETTVAATNKITLPKAPLGGASSVHIEKADGTKLDGTIANTDYTISTSGVTTGEKVKVYPYKYQSDATAERIIVNANDYATGGTAVLQTYVRNADGNVIGELIFEFPRALPAGNWNIDTTSEASPMETKLDFKIAKETSDRMMEIIYLPKV